MKLRDLRLKRQPRLMIIPMIDIIFFLLVFFMMSTLYMVEQRTIPVQLPHTVSAKADLEQSLAVTVTKDGRIYVEQEEMPLELVKKRIEIELNRQKDVLVVLRSDTQAEYGKVVAVLDELKLAGVRKLAMVTEKKAR